MRHIAGVFGLFCAVLLGASAPAAGQGIFGKIGNKVKQTVSAKSDQAVDSALNHVANAVVCAMTDKMCIAKAHEGGKPIKVTDASGKPVSSADSAAAISSAVAAAAAAAEPALDSAGSAAPAGAAGAAAPAMTNTVLVNYDFVPGDRVIFAEDFTNDNIGDFPKRLDLKSGNLEVAEWNGARYLRSTSSAQIIVPLPEVLPQRFTFEMDFSGSTGWTDWIEFADPDHEPSDLAKIAFSPIDGGVDGPVSSRSNLEEDAQRPVTHVAVMADNMYVKVYINGVRVGNAPKADLGRAKGILISMTASESEPAYISNIRVAEGGKPLYDALAATGRVATHGILFDVGSNHIRAESTPTLKNISDMLTAHPGLKLTIEGHTDNVGSAPSNQTLSEQRAAAVKQYLVTNAHIDASRLATKGYGSTKPIASNTTPEGRQQNRRVELVKM